MSNKLSLLVNFVAVDKLSGSLRNIVGLGRKGSQSLNALRGEGRKLENQLAKVRRELKSSGDNVDELKARERELEAAIERTNQQLERRKRLNQIEADQRAITRRGQDLQSRGADHMQQGAALAAPFILATAAAAQFSSGMVDIQQKANLSDAAAGRLSERIMVMSDRARQMPEDIRSGLDLLLAQGMGLDAANAAIGPAGRLATAYKVDIPDAAAAAYASINNLKVASAQTARVFDVMAAAGNEGGFEVRDMARHFPSLTAQMQALGAKGIPAVADLSAALQVAMNTAGSADEAANNIQNLLGKINAPSTIAAFKKNFGIDLPAAMKKLEEQGYTSMEAIALLTKKATGGDMKKLGFAFEDQQARMGVLALIQNMEQYRQIRAAAMNSTGTVDKAFDQRVARDAMVQWTAFKSSVSQLAITLGATLLPVANEALGMISRLASGVAAWAQRNPGLAAGLTKIAAGLVVFKIGVGAAMWSIGSILGPFAKLYGLFAKVDGISKFGTAMLRFKTIITSVGPVALRAFGMMRTAALFLAQGVMRAGAMMLANPIVLVITAIVLAIAGAAYLIYTHWDTIKAAFTAGVDWVKAKLNGMPAWLKNIGSMMMQGLLMAINPLALGAKLIQMAKNGITAFRNYLGIKSPSRVMMALGQHTTEGLAIGIDRGGRRPVSAMGRLATGITAAGAMAIAPAMPAAARGGAASASGGAAPITINIYQQPGEDAEALAARIERILDRRAQTAARGSYVDRD